MVIQRSWKILSDTGSTSASSTEANRSPSGLHSSSDDSNCSNQTTHSMVTSVASPHAVTAAAVATAAAAAAATTNAVKLDVLPSTNVTPTVTSTNVESMKFVTTPHMAETMLQRLRQRLGCPVVAGGSGASSESAMRSLELLRIGVQSYFDTEIDAVVQRFLENYFKPAFTNIKENLGQSAVSEDTLQKMSCALLENAKAQYNAFRLKPHQQTVAYLNTTAHSADHGAAIRVSIKRPAAKTTNSTEHHHLLATKKLCSAAVVTTATQQLQAPAAVRATIAALATQSTPLLPQPQQLKTTQPPAPLPQITVAAATAPTSATIVAPLPAARRQIFWNTAHISTTTKFVLDVQANQAFGFGSDGKERLASKHPELIRYLPDSEDRDWLTAQNIISQLNRNSRFLFLIHDEVCRLQATHENYRNKATVDLAIMHTFSVPEFMIQKMKLFFVDLNIKSRGLITNSFSVGNSHLRNALLQGIQSGGGLVAGASSSAATATASTAATTATIVSTLVGGSVVNDSGASSSASSSLTVAATSSGSGGVSTSSDAVFVVSTLSQQPLRPKTSTLSSSHATLTALLNNSGASSTGTIEKVASSSGKVRK